ncbi:hypothetical protein GCM10027610_051940 [Dactylosporangium cerinum]
MPTVPQQRDATDGRVRIGLWGATGGGKTTYLGALGIASIRGCSEDGRWNVGGVSTEATKFLTDMTDLLARGRRFPAASIGVEPLSWFVHGDLRTGPEDQDRAPVKERRGWFRGHSSPARPSRAQIEFVLQLQDIPGNRFLLDEANPADERVLDNLCESDGLLYLFDPIRDTLADDGQQGNFEYFNRVLQHLRTRLWERDRLVEGRLPHHVAVCVTKFDDPIVFAQAVDAGAVSLDGGPRNQPHVPNGRKAHKFFDWLCDHAPSSGADLVRDALSVNFHADRVAYFVCSSIGFSLNRDHVLDLSDYSNVLIIDGEPRIRDQIYPINVLEPLIGLERRITTGSW